VTGTGVAAADASFVARSLGYRVMDAGESALGSAGDSLQRAIRYTVAERTLSRSMMSRLIPEPDLLGDAVAVSVFGRVMGMSIPVGGTSGMSFLSWVYTLDTDNPDNLAGKRIRLVLLYETTTSAGVGFGRPAFPNVIFHDSTFAVIATSDRRIFRSNALSASRYITEVSVTVPANAVSLQPTLQLGLNGTDGVTPQTDTITLIDCAYEVIDAIDGMYTSADFNKRIAIASAVYDAVNAVSAAGRSHIRFER